MPTVPSVDSAYIDYFTTFAWHTLTTGTMFPLVIIVERLFPVFLYTLPLATSQAKSVCVVERIGVCAATRIYITCTSAKYVDMPEPSHPRGRGRRHA